MSALDSASSDSGSVEICTEYDDDYDEDDEEAGIQKKTEDYMTSEERVRKMIEMKGMQLLGDETRWRESVRQQMESELSRRVREALDTPPLERIHKRNVQVRQQRESPDINAHLLSDLTHRDRDFLRAKRWKSLPENKRGHAAIVRQTSEVEFSFQGEIINSDADDENFSDYRKGILSTEPANYLNDYSLPEVHSLEVKPKLRHFCTKESCMRVLRSGYLPDGIQVIGDGKTCVDKYGIIRDKDGPFWPTESVPLFATPRFKWWNDTTSEPLHNLLSCNSQTVESQCTQFKGKWRGIQVAFDSERSPRDSNPLPIPEGCCPTLMFESRFECGNLRQARRVGQFEYELVLKSDLYTARHTQWYYFRLSNAVPGITYKFRIINLLKKDSLYNYGMRPLMYSEHDAREKQRGWMRTGQHISYTRNCSAHTCPLLERGVTYYVLEWQMEFPNSDDTYYLAHCYPYSFTDLKEDLELLMNNEERSKVTRREVMCETRAGNSCFLLTITNFDCREQKKAVVVTARVHPGESQSSWMMKGLLEFITGPDPAAGKLRNKFVFKIVPMINPDGVIVGNYRCSLAARDLNRNYRHPRRESFPTIWCLKNMVYELARKHQIALYCDLHGHSRKPNAFMYGNNTSTDVDISPDNMAMAFISERLFPWLMSVRSPDKFHFKSCKFQIRRCKESTGRVVMWRQMKVLNSFTLEATFSGTVLDRENCRHFNIQDFMDMGKVLAQTVLDYQIVKDDPVKQTQTVLDLTRAITEQILTCKGLPSGLLSGFISPGTGRHEEVSIHASQETWTKSCQDVLNNTVQVAQESKSSEIINTPQPTLQLGGVDPARKKEVAVQILEKLARGRTVEDCLDLLVQMDIQNAIEESDSSDSDSETDPEMRPLEPKTRKKKRKSKKQRDKDNEKRLTGAASENKKANNAQARSTSRNLPFIAESKALPTLSATCQSDGNHVTSARNENSILWQAKQVAAEKYRAGRGVSGFISKYEGRHNGGLPCFTEERSMERAAKRIEELRHRSEGRKMSGNGSYIFQWADENELSSGTHETQRLYDFQGSDITGQQSANVRTRYTHADSLQEHYPPTLQPANDVNFCLKNMSAQSSCHDKNHQDLSLTDGHENKEYLKQKFPLTARRSPYHQPDPSCPHPASEFTVYRHSYISRNSGALFTATPSSSVTAALSASAATATHLPHAATSNLISRGRSIISPLTVSSLSTVTPKSASNIRPSSTHTRQETTADHRGDPKLKPLMLLGHQKDSQANSNIVADSPHVIKKTITPIAAVTVSNPQNDTENQKNVSGNFGSQQKSSNLTHLVNHLAQNLLGVSSTLHTSKSQLVHREQLRFLAKNSHNLKATSSLMPGNTAASDQAILSDNLTTNRVDTKSKSSLRQRSTDH